MFKKKSNATFFMASLLRMQMSVENKIARLNKQKFICKNPEFKEYEEKTYGRF